MGSGRRLYLYAAALVSYLALLASLTGAARRLILGLAGGDSPARALLDGAGSWWLLLAILALALWLGHWLPANRAARPLTMAAAAERASLPRKTCLLLGQLVTLAAAVAQAVYGLQAALLGLLGGTVWLDEVIALGAGAGLALAAWGYLRWEHARDDDAGREARPVMHLRRFYVYLFALAGLALAFGGAGETLRALVSLLARPLDAGTVWREPLAGALAALGVGLPLALAAWRAATRAAGAAPAAEMNALGRVALRYAALLLGTVITLVSLGYLIEQLVLLILRQPRWATAVLNWTHAVAYLPGAVLTWAIFADGIRDDVALGGEHERTATVRRLTRYGIAGLALAAVWFATTEFTRLILQVVLGAPGGGLAFAADWWGRFARATALVLVAAPAWWGHWWSQQTRARAAGPAGQAERASAIRRVYLWAVVLSGAVLVVAALGFAAFLALNWSAAAALGGVRTAVATAVAAAAVALLWAGAHALVLRGDARWRAAEAPPMTPPVASPAAPPLAEAPAAAPPAPVAGPRRYRREELAALAASAGFPVPARPLAVVDGADGAIGAALVAALRQARPDLPIWPIGLNAAAQVALLNALGGAMAPAVPADALHRVAAILGPADILAPGGLDGEVTAELAAAVASSPARALLLPPRDPRLRWVAAPDWPLARWVENAVTEVNALVS